MLSDLVELALKVSIKDPKLPFHHLLDFRVSGTIGLDLKILVETNELNVSNPGVIYFHWRHNSTRVIP
jgi:hypothetical protein